MSTQVDLRRLSPLQRGYVLAYKRAYHRAGIEYRQGLAILADAHRREMTALAHTYDRELATLSADFAALARSHHEDLVRRAVAEAQAERSANRPLH